MWGKKNVWKDEEEAHKDGRNMSYRDGIEAPEVSQSKERKKLGGEGFLSFGTKIMDIMMKMTIMAMEDWQWWRS